MWLLKIQWVTLWSEIEKDFYLYFAVRAILWWAIVRLCWKEEPLHHYQLSAHFEVGLWLLGIQQGGHLPVTSCHRTDRPMWMFLRLHKVTRHQLEYSGIEGSVLLLHFNVSVRQTVLSLDKWFKKSPAQDIYSVYVSVYGWGGKYKDM